MWKALIEDLYQVFTKEAFLNITINKRINSLDDDKRKLYTKIMYGVVDKKLWIDFILKPYTKGKTFKPYIRNALRIGVYTNIYLNLESFFVVNELVEVIKQMDYKGSKVVNGILRNYIRDNRLEQAIKELNKMKPNEKAAIEYNVDQNILLFIKNMYPNDYKDILSPADDIYNTYRINLLKITKSDVEKQLISYHYEIIDDCLIIKEPLINTSLFKEGYITAQDYSSMMVAHTINPSINDSILDCCAAPGSKAFHLSSLMNNTGIITACDIYQHKINLMEKDCVRLGVTNVKFLLADATSYNYPNNYDIVLADVPCSGLGTLKHKSDLKLKLNLTNINEIIALQAKILDHVYQYVKKGGFLVYSTCTINKDENENQIVRFLVNHPEFTKINEISILPSNKKDGFYICKLQKEA